MPLFPARAFLRFLQEGLLIAIILFWSGAFFAIQHTMALNDAFCRISLCHGDAGGGAGGLDMQHEHGEPDYRTDPHAR